MATQATGEPTPAAPGQTETFAINGLSDDTQYYVALKSSDGSSNISALSNVASGTTLVEANAPDVAADEGIMTIIDLAVSIAVGQVEDLVNKYGPKFDQSDMCVKLIRATLLGVKQGTDALLLPGGPPPIPGPDDG